jgi:acetolactate synthase-1/2/3 large subunit
MPGCSRDGSPTPIAPPTGGRILVDALRAHGVTRIFCVPGESYLDVLDALHDVPEIDLIVTKHEGAAANMAEADGKLTGRPGICFVTRGPGATHASVGVHTAAHDSTPLILLIGQIERGFRDREGFQEVDYRAMFGGLAKWVAEIDTPERIPEYLLRAFQVATSGRPGPVVLSLPEDMLAETAAAVQPQPFQPVQAALSAAQLEQIATELQRASKPILIVGGGGWTLEATAALQRFAETFALPVVASFRRQDLFDNQHPQFAGHLTLVTSPPLLRRIREADLLVVLGARLGEVATAGYRLLHGAIPGQRLIQLHADPTELSRVFQADLPIAVGTAAAAFALAGLTPRRSPVWRDWTRELRVEFESFTDPGGVSIPNRGVDLTSVVRHLQATLPPDAVIANGAGNFSVWLHRFFRYRRFGTQLAPTSGAMGYGFPAAIAAKLRDPARLVVCFTGDGDFLMYPQELATARQFGAAVIVILVNNGLYGTIRMHQARRFPGRIVATALEGTDFVALAKSFGAHAERVATTDGLAAAFERALAAGSPALLELITDPDQITPTQRLTDGPER